MCTEWWGPLQSQQEAKSLNTQSKVVGDESVWPTPLFDSYYNWFDWLIFKKETTTITTKMGIVNLYPWIFDFNGGLMFLNARISFPMAWHRDNGHFSSSPSWNAFSGWMSNRNGMEIHRWDGFSLFTIWLSFFSFSFEPEKFTSWPSSFRCLSDISKKRASSFISTLTLWPRKPSL